MSELNDGNLAEQTSNGKEGSSNPESTAASAGAISFSAASASMPAASNPTTEMEKSMKWDVFISHATEDKFTAAGPLADALRAHGFKVWSDNSELTIGDSLLRKIDEGLANSRAGIVILSHNFFARGWPQAELTALMDRALTGEAVVLPVLCGLSVEDVKKKYSRIIAGFHAIPFEEGLEKVVDAVKKALGRPQHEEKPARAPEESFSAPEANFKTGSSGAMAPERYSLRRIIAGSSLGVTLAIVGFGAWQANVIGIDQCTEAFNALEQLDVLYGYGSCTLSGVENDDSRLGERIEPVLRRVAACNPRSQPDPDRIAFYKDVQADLRNVRSVCEEAGKAGPEKVWLRLHCLQRRFDSPEWRATDGPDWAKLAGDFEKLIPNASDPTTRGRLWNCAAISRALAYQMLAGITGRPEATEHMIAAANTIKHSDEGRIAQLVASGVANYGLPTCKPGPECWITREDLDEANETLGKLLVGEPELLWRRILPQSHRQLWLAAMGVVIDRMAPSGDEREGEPDFVYSFGRLESDLRKANQGAAADFLVAEQGMMKRGWYHATVRDARDNCRSGLADRQRSGAITLKHMRIIYGWWVQTELAGGQWEELQETTWLAWWKPEDELTTTLCGLATARIAPTEARLRFERLLRQVPENGQLCYFDRESELWAAGAKRLPWLNEMVRDRCVD